MTGRLLATADSRWEAFDGWAAARNVDPLRLPASRFLNLIYHWLTADGDPADVDKFDRKLWQPPVGVAVEIPKESPWSAENETAALSAFASQVGAR